MVVTTQGLGTPIKKSQNEGLGMSESTIKKNTVKNIWKSFKKRKTKKKYNNKWRKVQVYIRTDEEKCFFKCSKDSLKAYREL